MHVLAGVLIVVGLASLSSCRTQHSASVVSEPEAGVALVSPRKVPTLAQLIPILEGPESPELKLRKLRKLIPIYDDLTKWRIDHNERLVEILPFKNRAKPLAFILAGNDYMKLKKPDPKENNAKDKEYDYKNSDNSVNSKHDFDIRRKGYKSDKESSNKEIINTHTKLESRNYYNDENNKKLRIHNSGLSYKNENKNHKNKDYKSELNSNESEYESDEPSNESNESFSEESGENKSSYNKNYAKEKNSENDRKKDRKEHESQKSHPKHEKSFRKSKYFDNSYYGKHEKHSQEHSSELRHKNRKNKNIDNSNSGSYSNEFENESNEPSNEDNKSWSKDSEDNESWNEDDESKSTKNKSIEHKNESIEKTSQRYYNYNKTKHLNALNKFSIDDPPSQASTSVSQGLLSNRPYFIPHSTKPNIPLTDSNRDSIFSKSEENLTDNSESVNVISSEIRTETEESPKSVHVSLESDDVPEDSNVEFKASVASINDTSESSSDSVSEESQSNTELNKSRSDAQISTGSEHNSIPAESDESKELPVGQFRSIFPVKSSNKETIDSASDINSNDFKYGTDFKGSDLGLNQSESSVKSNESQSEYDSNDIPEATSDSELAVSGSDSNSDAFESLTDNYSSESYISNESTFDSSGTEPKHSESTSESISTSVSHENSDYESISKYSVSDVSKVPELDSNFSGYDSISDSESVTDGVQDVKLNEYENVTTEKSNGLRGSESEANSNESLSYDGNEPTSDLESKKNSYEEKNESTSTDASESKSNMVDSSESGLKSNSSLELADFYLARISDDNDDIGDSGVIATEKLNEKLSDESRFANDDDRKNIDEMIENIFGLNKNNDIVNEESTNKDEHDTANEEHIYDDSYFDMTSTDASDNDVTEHYDKYEQDSTSTENEDLIEFITPNEHTEAGDDKEITPFVLLVDKHHHHHGHDTEAPNYKISMKEYNKYDVGDISSDNNNEEPPVVLEDYENFDKRNTVNSTKDQKFTPINIVLKKHNDVDATSKNIIIKYDKNRESSIIIDACTDKQDIDSNDHEKHGDEAESDNKHQNDVNTDNKEHNNTNNETNVSPKEKHQHKIYKLSFIFN